MKHKTIYSIIIALSILGIGLASYLLYLYYTPPHESLCYINSYINCDASTKGSLANTLGIPTGLYGLLGYLFILIAALKYSKKAVLGLAVFGTLFCLRITFLEIFVIKEICPVCLVCQISMILIFLLALFLFKNEKKQE